MFSSSFWHFLTLQIFKERHKHLTTLLLSILLLFLLSSMLFIASSLRYVVMETLEGEPDFVITRIQGGDPASTPLEWMDPLFDIYGITQITPRVYGRYFVTPKEESFLIVGVDPLEEQSQKALKELLEGIDIKHFSQGDTMLVGQGVARYLKAHYYYDGYKFLTPTGEFISLKIASLLPVEGNLLSNDMVIMPLEVAQKILGYASNEVRDIGFNVPNPDERANIMDKVASLHYDLRIVSKTEMAQRYRDLYSYKEGIFLLLFIMLLVTFLLTLYQRYSMVYSSEKRQIGLLRAMGWSIADLLRLKFMETVVVVMFAFILGVILAYWFVFVWDAPLLRQIFLGSENLPNFVSFPPVVEFSTLGSIFLLYVLPSLAAVMIPVWRVAITDAKEAML